MGGRPWSQVSAEVQGSGHKKTDTPCQDKTICISRNKVHLIALADGAGSASLSHYGAEAVITQVGNYVVDNFDNLCELGFKEIKASIAQVMRHTLEALSIQLGCEKRDLSSTFLLVAVKRDRFISIHVGDGVIGILDRDGLKVLSSPENGEYANMTWFTTASSLEAVMRIYAGDASITSGFILMSDGVEPSLYNGTDDTLADAVFNLMYMNAKCSAGEMKAMLEDCLANVISLRTRDDCSLALLSRTRFKNFDEYSKYRRKVAKRERAERKCKGL